MGIVVMIVGGLALVVFDFRTAAPDLLPDIVGWALIAIAARRLGLAAATYLAGAAGVASLTDVWLSYRHVVVDPVTGEPVPGAGGVDRGGPVNLVYDDVSGWRLAALSLAAVLAGLAVWTLLVGIGNLLSVAGREGPARRFHVAGWLILATWTVPFLAAVVNAVVNESGAFDPVWNGGLVYVWLVSLVLFGYVGVLLIGERDEAWARPGHGAGPPSWPAPTGTPTSEG